MQDEFHGKKWIYWVQLLVAGALGLLSLDLGISFWSGKMLDANHQARPDAGPPLVVMSCVLLAIAALAAFNLIGRIKPMIRCYREGIECNLIGATSLDGIPFVPGGIRIAWTILSLQGFRAQRVRISWREFQGALVRGIPMAYVLSLNGEFTNLKTGEARHGVAFKQVALEDHPEQIAERLNRLFTDPARRERLDSWEGKGRLKAPTD
jgi:hypothetical protein